MAGIWKTFIAVAFIATIGMCSISNTYQHHRTNIGRTCECVCEWPGRRK